jgi:hypothetical protein
MPASTCPPTKKPSEKFMYAAVTPPSGPRMKMLGQRHHAAEITGCEVRLMHHQVQAATVGAPHQRVVAVQLQQQPPGRGAAGHLVFAGRIQFQIVVLQHARVA